MSKRTILKPIISLLIALTISSSAFAGTLHDRSWAFGVLGVGEESAPDDIKSAFRKRAKELHPDAGGSHDAFVELNEAYDILSQKTSTNRREGRRQADPIFKYAVPVHRSHLLYMFQEHPMRDRVYGLMDEWDRQVGNDLYNLFAQASHKSKKALSKQFAASTSILEDNYFAHKAFAPQGSRNSLPANIGQESDANLRRIVSEVLLNAEFEFFFQRQQTPMAFFFVEYLKVALPNHDFSVATKFLESGWGIDNPLIWTYLERAGVDSVTQQFVHDAEVWRLKIDPNVFEHLDHFVRMARARTISWDELFDGIMGSRRQPTIKNLASMTEILSHVPTAQKRKMAFRFLLNDVPIVSEVPELREMILDATSNDIRFIFPEGEVFPQIKRNRALLYQALSNIEQLEPGLLVNRIESRKTEFRSGTSGYGDGLRAANVLRSFSRDSAKLLREIQSVRTTATSNKAAAVKLNLQSIRSCEAVFSQH
ncbi:MAG: J domain-containing protein [Proteobacteria bacterium]|nr:MAG: J domain-containing protein [Pseudomonadota bacterium]